MMQWAGNECSLSGGLNSYISIGLTEKIRNHNTEYYLQDWELISGYVTTRRLNCASLFVLLGNVDMLDNGFVRVV